ncbi:TPA: hypothetical protein KB391_005543, partial [Escherichia coli]|nr:hypothetical protein [Escherichia coli]
ATLGLMSTYLLTPIDFLQLIVISLCLPISIGSSTRMLISPHLLICSSMPMSISLLMLIDFPILEAMSTYLLTPIDFLQLIATSLHLPISIDL